MANPWESEKLLTDFEGKPIPQGWNEALKAFDALRSILGNMVVTLGTALDKDTDSITTHAGKGGVTTAIPAGTTADATSAEIDCRGYNAVSVHVDLSGTAGDCTVKLQGSPTSGGKFVDWYDGTTQMKSPTLQATSGGQGFTWRGIPDFIKVVYDEGTDGVTATVKVQPINV